MKYEDINKCFNVFNLATKEVRGIGQVNGNRCVVSGWFPTVADLITALEKREHLQLNWYFVFNEIDLYNLDGKMRRNGPLGDFHSSKECIGNEHIIRRRWVMLDFDPIRQSNTSSTVEQLQEASKTAQRVWDFLFHNGFHNYVGCCSGNGYHIMLPCEMEVNDLTDRLVKDFLKVISMLFSTDQIAIDTAVHNRARLTKLYGTVSHKGEHTPQTPHRTSCFRHMIERWKPIKQEYFQKIVNAFMTPVVLPEASNNYGRGRFDLKNFLESYNIAYTAKTIAGGMKYTLESCVFNSEHKKPDSAVFQFDDGRLGFKCFHNSCSAYHWKEFREKVEISSPNVKTYSAKDYVEFKQTESVVENDWLNFEQINAKQADDILRIPTGFVELDRSLSGGLAAGGLTVLTGVNGCGKSVFLINVILNICDKDFKVGLFSGEMQSWRLKSWFLSISRGLFSDIEQNNALIEKSLKDKLFIYNNANGNQWDKLFESVRQLVETKAVQLVVLDNMACMNMNNVRADKYEQQSVFVKELADFSRRLGIHVILVAHPRKSFGLVRKSDISGTYDLSNMADNVLILHKVNDDFKKSAKEFWRKDTSDMYCSYDNLIEVAKNRDAGDERVIGLYYEIYSKRLKNQLAETVHYSWEKEIEGKENIFKFT